MASAAPAPNSTGTEFDFRYSNRADMGITDAMRAAEAVRGVVGKRLTYDQAS